MSEEKAMVKVQPAAPVKSVTTLKGLLEQAKAQIAEIAPKHLTPDRLMRMMLVAVNRTPKLLECTQASILETVMRAASTGLDISGTLGEAYPVPFRDKKSGRMMCQFIPGYAGLAKLARQSGEVGRIEAEPVYERDLLEYEKGMDFKIRFVPKLDGDRGKLKGFYMLAMSPDGKVPMAADYMTVEEVQTVQRRAPSGNSPAWKDHFPEMGRKTVFRRGAKWLPKSSGAFEQALALDQDYEGEMIDVTPEDAPPVTQQPGESQGDALARQLEQGKTAARAPQIDDETAEGLGAGEGEKAAQTAAEAAAGPKFPVEVVKDLPYDQLHVQGLLDLRIPGVKKGMKREEMVAAVAKWVQEGTQQIIPAEPEPGSAEEFVQTLDKIQEQEPGAEGDDEEPSPEEQERIKALETARYFGQNFRDAQHPDRVRILRDELEPHIPTLQRHGFYNDVKTAYTTACGRLGIKG